MTLTESQDDTICAAAPRLATGRKWIPSEAVQHVKYALRHGDIVGLVQYGRGTWIRNQNKLTHMAQGNNNPEEKVGGC